MNRTFETFAVITVSLAGIFVAARMGAVAPGIRHPRVSRIASQPLPRPEIARRQTHPLSRLNDRDVQLPCATLTPSYSAGCGADRATGEQYAEPIFSRPQITRLDMPLLRLPEADAFAPLETTGYDAAYDRSLTPAVVETDSVRFGPAVWGRNASEPSFNFEVSALLWAESLPQLEATCLGWRRAKVEQEYAAAELAAAGAISPTTEINLADAWRQIELFARQQLNRIDRHPLEWFALSGEPAAGEVQIDGLSPAELAVTLQANSRRSADRKPVREAAANRIRKLPAAPANRAGN